VPANIIFRTCNLSTTNDVGLEPTYTAVTLTDRFTKHWEAQGVIEICLLFLWTGLSHEGQNGIEELREGEMKDRSCFIQVPPACVYWLDLFADLLALWDWEVLDFSRVKLIEIITWTAEIHTLQTKSHQLNGWHQWMNFLNKKADFSSSFQGQPLV
jgi:hypothetical protein